MYKLLRDRKMGMKRHIDNFITGAIDWLFRKRSTGLNLIRLSVLLLPISAGASWGLNLVVPTSSGSFYLSLDIDQGIPACVMAAGLTFSVLLFVVGLVVLIIEQRRLGRKRVVAIELRGLRDTTGDPLKDRIPSKILGRREQILVNIRRSDGKILDPNDALPKVVNLPTSISHLEEGGDRSDIVYVAGGLAPVPFSFLMGVQLDDEGAVTLMDWDRNLEDWRTLDGNDDGDRFTVSGMDKIGHAEEIVVSVSVSYQTNMSAITQKFSDQPVVSLTLSKLATDGHWSEEKQVALAQEFFDTMRALCSTDVRKVNLILAAPNSVVIRFGRIYDKRNLPALIVWQYENGQTPTYPWGVNMPVAGNKAEIIQS